MGLETGHNMWLFSMNLFPVFDAVIVLTGFVKLFCAFMGVL